MLINALKEACHYISFCAEGSIEINYKDGAALRRALGLQLKDALVMYGVTTMLEEKKKSAEHMRSCFSTYVSVFDHTKLNGPTDFDRASQSRQVTTQNIYSLDEQPKLPEVRWHSYTLFQEF